MRWAPTDALRTITPGRGEHSSSLPNRGRRTLTCSCLDSDLLCCGVWHCLRNSIHQLFVRWEHSYLNSGCPAHTPQRPHECPPAPHKGLFPHWSLTQAQKPKCPQRQTCLSLGPSVSVPTVASLEKCQCPVHGAALHPLPLSLRAGAPFRALGWPWERQQSFSSRIQTEMSETEPGKVATLSPAKPQLPARQARSCCAEGRPFPWESHPWHLHTAEPGIRHGAGNRGSFSILLLIWKM